MYKYTGGSSALDPPYATTKTALLTLMGEWRYCRVRIKEALSNKRLCSLCLIQPFYSDLFFIN